MIETATLDTAREGADVASRLIDLFGSEEGGGKSVRDILPFARLLWRSVRGTWEQFQLRLDRGLDADQARPAAASALRACDSLLRVLAKLQATLGKEATGEVDGLPQLLAAVPEAEAIQKAAHRLVDTLSAPAPPIDKARLDEGLAALGRGEFEDTAAILERLRAGGEL